MDFEDLLKKLGGFGKWQKIQWFLLFLTTIPQAWYSYAPAFTAAKPKLSQASCALPTGINPCDANCSKVVFDVEYRSIVTDWPELICDGGSKIAWTKSIFYIGKLMGAYFFGWLSDRKGRWFVLLLTTGIQFVFSLIQSFSVNYYMFLFLRYPMGFCSGGNFIMAFALATEMVRPRWRGIANGIIQSGYGVGIAVQALLSWAVKEWPEYNLLLTLPNILFISYWWLVPESPRWLLARGKKEKSEKILRRIAAGNGVEYPEGAVDEVERTLYSESNHAKKKIYHMHDLFKSKQLAKITCIEGYSWFVVSLVYYGLGFNSGNLSGDMYLNFALSGLVEIPAYMLASYLVDRIGRRVPVIMYFVVGGVSLLCILPIRMTGNEEKLADLIIALALIGKFAISAAFYQVYIHSAELFPTVIRGLGVGFSSMCSRVGGIMAPLIVDIAGKDAPFIVFGITSLLAGILSFFLPETKGKPLPELSDLLKNRLSVKTLSTQPVFDENENDEEACSNYISAL